MEKFCRDCGCEILSEDDLGYESCDDESQRDAAFIICRSCKDDEERGWKAFQLTDEFKYECAFNKWVKTL